MKNKKNKTESSPTVEVTDSVGTLKTEKTWWQKFWASFVNFWTNKSTKEMLIYILKRILLLIFTFLVIFVICFILVRLLPISIDSGLKDETVFYKQLVAQGRYGHDEKTNTYYQLPIIQQLWNFIKGLGSDMPFGFSYKINWLKSPT